MRVAKLGQHTLEAIRDEKAVGRRTLERLHMTLHLDSALSGTPWPTSLHLLLPSHFQSQLEQDLALALV